jgi:hypothetical protein
MRIPFTAFTRGGPLAAAAFGLLFRLTVGAPAVAQEAGTRSVFDHGAGNRALAMGGAYGAIADDASGLLWNPGGLGRVPRLEFQAGQTSYFALGIHETWLMGALPSYRWGAFAATFRYLGVSGIEMRDDRDFVVGDPTSDSQSELTLGYGHRVGESFAVGGTLKARHQSLAGFSASGFGIDAGATGYPAAVLGLDQEWARNTSVGLSISNLVRPSRRLDDESVADPMTLRAGFAWRDQVVGLRTIVVSLDIEKPEQLTPVAHLGFEFQPVPQLALRGGMSGGTLTAGTGVRYRGVALDYTFENRAFDGLHRFGLSYAFGPTVDESREAARIKEEERLQARLEEGFRRRQTGQVDELVERARSLRSRGEYETALELLGTAAALDTVRTDVAPLVAACEIGQALQLETAGNYSNAAIAYARALVAAPGDERATAGHARCQAQSDQRAARGEETRQWFAEALDAFGADDLSTARARLQQVLVVMPDDRETCRDAAAHRGRDRPPGARADAGRPGPHQGRTLEGSARHARPGRRHRLGRGGPLHRARLGGPRPRSRCGRLGPGAPRQLGAGPGGTQHSRQGARAALPSRSHRDAGASLGRRAPVLGDRVVVKAGLRPGRRVDQARVPDPRHGGLRRRPARGCGVVLAPCAARRSQRSPRLGLHRPRAEAALPHTRDPGQQ